jgi:glycosyltransferase involved in cell wall biosynthesis
MTAVEGKGKLSVAFTDLSQGKWTAGGQYLQNLFRTLRQSGASSELVLLRAPGASNEASRLREWVDREIAYPEAPPSPGFWAQRGAGVRRRIGLERSRPHQLGTYLRERGVDVLFSNTQYGEGFDLPLLSWIPDFQHVHLPHLFSGDERRVRDEEFRRIACFASRIVVSSRDALGDLREFSPGAEQKARVLSFVAHFSPEAYQVEPRAVAARYSLPERFVYLPNQFWKHKNHHVALQALSLVKQRHPEAAIVCTGNTNDYRDPLFFGEFLAEIHRRGLRSNFLVLGLLPHAELLPLIRQSVAVLQPSRFEGWSTTVEEVKAVGKPIILSDLPVHREQDPPNARYFHPDDAELLADHLREAFDALRSGPDPALELAARERIKGRVQELAATFVRTATEAASGRLLPAHAGG